MRSSQHVSLDIKGFIEVRCIVSAKNKTKQYTGFAQTKKSDNLNNLIERATQDCVFQHFRQIGVMQNNRFNNSGEELASIDYQTKVLSYKMHYVNLVNVKRVSKKLKGKRINRGGHYFTQSIDNENNIISEEKWTKNSIKNINNKKSKTYLIQTTDKKTGEVLKIEKPNYIREL